MLDIPIGDQSSSGLGQRVRSLRTAFGLSQQELARRAHVSQARISQIESGRDVGPLPPRMLYGLADGLGVDLDALIDGDPVYDIPDLDHIRTRTHSLVSVPHPIASLVGRADDLEAVVGRLRSDVRLLSLVGSGGVGKTQLAIHAAREMENDFPQGMFFVSLAEFSDPGAVVSAIARGVGLRERGALPLRDRLLSDFPSGRVLLILDNVEQVVSAVAELSGELIAAYPDLSLLVTSRTPLNVRRERRYVVHPLGFPDSLSSISAATAGATPAVELFVERVGEVLSGFTLTDANAPQVAAICQRLDGLPLAIELAAPRLRVFSPVELLRQLERRLTFVKSSSRDLPARQRSLRANICWSFDLLDSEHQKLLRRLAVFVGGFTLDAAAAVARGDANHSQDEVRSIDKSEAAIAESVSTLLDQHLLTQAEHADGVPRFRMLETIHEYAREQLETAGEAAELSARHLAWCLSLAERAVPKMFTAAETAWLDRLQEEDANLQAALTWAFGSGQEPDLEVGLRLAGALTDYWYVSGQLSQGRDWLTQAIALSANRGPSTGRARCLVGACLIEQTQAAIESAQAHGEEGLALARALDDEPTIGRALLLIGNVAMMQGELDRARSLHEKALSIFDRLGDRAWSALAYINLGMDFHRQGDLERATHFTELALAVTRAIGDRWDTIVALRLMGDLARDRGDLDEAEAHFAESLALAQRYGSAREAADSLSGIGTVAAVRDPERAARVLGAAETLYRHLGIAIPPPLRPDWPSVVARIQEGLEPDRFARAWASATPEHAIREVMARAPF